MFPTLEPMIDITAGAASKGEARRAWGAGAASNGEARRAWGAGAAVGWEIVVNEGATGVETLGVDVDGNAFDSNAKSAGRGGCPAELAEFVALPGCERWASWSVADDGGPEPNPVTEPFCRSKFA